METNEKVTVSEADIDAAIEAAAADIAAMEDTDDDDSGLLTDEAPADKEEEKEPDEDETDAADDNDGDTVEAEEPPEPDGAEPEAKPETEPDKKDEPDTPEVEEKTAEEKTEPEAAPEPTKAEIELAELLKALGAKSAEDAIAAATGQSLNEILAQREKEKKSMETAKAFYEFQMAAKVKADLDELNRIYPALGITDLRQLPNAKRYGELRDLGLSATEAIVASNKEFLDKQMTPKKPAPPTKDHQIPAAGKPAPGKSDGPTREERRMIRETFGNEITEEELLKYYKRVRNS